jgi:hypothetical protein
MSNPIVSIETAATRREIIRGLALALTTSGILDLEAAQHVHNAASGERKTIGSYTPKAFTAHEYATVRRLAEIIVPADDISGSAVDAGAPEFIDLLCSQNTKLANIFHGGLAWLDVEMTRRHDRTFVDCDPKLQSEMLDLLVDAEREERSRRNEELVYRRSDDYKSFSSYTTHRQNPLAAGAFFFDWIR